MTRPCLLQPVATRLSTRLQLSPPSPPIPIQTRRRLHSSPCVARDVWAKYRAPHHEPPSGPSSTLLKQIEPTFAPPAITGPRDKPVVVEGVKIPPKPIPPGDEGESAGSCAFLGGLHSHAIGGGALPDCRMTSIRLGAQQLLQQCTKLTSDCCMSGCVHCVLTIYAEDSEEYQTAMDEAKKRLEVKSIPHSEWPSVMKEIEERDTEKNEPAVDPTMAAFMA